MADFQAHSSSTMSVGAVEWCKVTGQGCTEPLS